MTPLFTEEQQAAGRAIGQESIRMRHDVDAIVAQRASDLPADRAAILRQKLVNVPTSWRIRFAEAAAGDASPAACILANCAECMGFEQGGPAECTSLACPLWTRRMG